MNQMVRIPTEQILDLAAVRASIARHARHGIESFTLPTASEGKNLVLVCPVSGGADSTVTALVIKALHPTASVRYVFTDTGFEVCGTGAALDRLEAVLGEPIIRIQQKVSLPEYIEQHGNYLPSQRSRYCTSSYKIKPYRDFLAVLRAKEGPNTEFLSFVGIRWDEHKRRAAEYSEADKITSIFPLQQLGLDRSGVYGILTETVGIPSFYADRTRSGCSVCWAGRRAEYLSTLRRDPKSYFVAAALENISTDEKERYERLATPVWKELRASSDSEAREFRVDLLDYPIPTTIFPRDQWMNPDADPFFPAWEQNNGKSRVSSKANLDFFGRSESLYVAVELHYLSGPSGLCLVRQQLVTFSTTMSGLSNALAGHFRHRMDSREMHTLWKKDEDELRESIRYSVFQIEFPEGSLASAKTLDGFTWSSDKYSLLQLRQLVSVIERALTVESIRLVRNRRRATSGEEHYSAKAALDALREESGTVLRGFVWEPPEISTIDQIVADDEEDKPLVCMSCTK